MKGKQIIWLGLGMVSICSMLYRAPQIAGAMNGSAGETPSGQPDNLSAPGTAISGLLQAMGKQPMTMDDLRAGGRAETEGEGREAPSAENLRVFTADAEASLEKTREMLERAAANSPANAISPRGNVAKADAAAKAKKPRQPAPKVTVHKPGE